MVQWLGFHASTAGDTGSIPGRGTKIPQAMWQGQKKTKKETPTVAPQWFEEDKIQILPGNTRPCKSWPLPTLLNSLVILNYLWFLFFFWTNYGFLNLQTALQVFEHASLLSGGLVFQDPHTFQCPSTPTQRPNYIYLYSSECRLKALLTAFMLPTGLGFSCFVTLYVTYCCHCFLANLIFQISWRQGLCLTYHCLSCSAVIPGPDTDTSQKKKIC